MVCVKCYIIKDDIVMLASCLINEDKGVIP